MRTTTKLLTLLANGGVSAPAAPTVSAAPTSTSNHRVSVSNISPTATTLKIYRSTDNVSFSLLDTVAVSGTSQNYDDGTITAGTNYYYKVGANNAAGEGLSTSSKANTLLWGWRDLHVYKLDEASGTRADSVGSTNLSVNGTGGVGSTSGVIGNGAAFVGANSQYLSAADAAPVRIGTYSFELCLFVNSSGSLASAIEIVSKRNGYIMQINSAGAILTVWCGGVTRIAIKSVALSTNTTYFLSGAFDTGAASVSMDVNDSGTRASTSTVTATVDDGTNPLAFGARPASNFLTGMMDIIFFGIGRTLVPAERTALRNGGAGFVDFLP